MAGWYFAMVFIVFWCFNETLVLHCTGTVYLAFTLSIASTFIEFGSILILVQMQIAKVRALADDDAVKINAFVSFLYIGLIAITAMRIASPPLLWLGSDFYADLTPDEMKSAGWIGR